jgi:carbon monoxide dehydrogenase subunit G
VCPLLSDPASVVPCVPGASLTGVNDEGALDGVIVTRLGPTRVTFTGQVVSTFDSDTRSGSLEARGSDARGRTKASAAVSFRLAAADVPEKSRLGIDATVDVSGGLASFVRSGGQHLARRMLEDFSTNLADLAAHGTAATAPSDGTAAEQTERRQPEAKPISGIRLIGRVILDVLRAVPQRLLPRSRGRSSKGRQQHERK